MAIPETKFGAIPATIPTPSVVVKDPEASTRAFGWPDGTVRAILAIIVIGGDMVMNCIFKWAPPNIDTMATVAFTFYFVSAVGTKILPATKETK